MTSLIISTVMVFITVIIHLAGLSALMAVMRVRADHIRPYESFLRQAVFLAGVVIGLFALHTLEIWAYAIVYSVLGEFASFEEALYFSTSAFTTVGFGDVIQAQPWRMVGAIESANGFLLIGWSTAFLLSVITRLRSAEFDWLDRRAKNRDEDLPG